MGKVIIALLPFHTFAKINVCFDASAFLFPEHATFLSHYLFVWRQMTFIGMLTVRNLLIKCNPSSLEDELIYVGRVTL